jgi:molybdopterin-containing oxidoreductase family membrane subunit
MSEFLSKEEGNKLLDKITWDLIRPTRSHKGLELWIVVLVLIMIAFGYAYFIQLRDGLGVTAMRDFVSWGMYIGNFVFFVAVSLVGFLITAVLGLLKFKWIEPISRIAEIVALAFVMVAGLVIVFDMGRPDRLHHVFIYGRFQSPILWDITVITTYVMISLLLFLLPLIPDMAIAAQRVKNLPVWQKKLYEILSFGFKHKPEQYKIIKKGMRILSILIMPVALAIHTVTSWLFASTLRPGWDTTIFGPYFVTGAFVAGSAAVIVMMGIFRSNFKLKDYIKEEHFDNMGKLLVFVSLVYLYFNVNEYLVPGYKMKEGDNEHLMGLFTGHWAPMFWTSQILGLVIPIILPIFKKFRTPKALTIISVLVVIGAWLKRYIIVVPTMLHPHLPIQNVPEEYSTYIPTGAEILVTLGTFGLTFVIITVLAKVFPVVPIWEVAKEKGIDLEKIND